MPPASRKLSVAKPLSHYVPIVYGSFIMDAEGSGAMPALAQLRRA
jgi:hypothetical protein